MGSARGSVHWGCDYATALDIEVDPQQLPQLHAALATSLARGTHSSGGWSRFP
jgi:hypothetical protein